MTHTTTKGNRERWDALCRHTGMCSHCGQNRGENRKRVPKCDRYKDKRRGRL